MSIILRVTNNKGEVFDLQPINDIDLRLDISAIENTEIGTSFGISSQEFAIAGTNEANQFFGNLYNLGATPAVALINSVDCQVLSDSQEVFTGKLYIRDIITDQQGYTIYNTIVVNETIDFKYRIQNLALNDPKFDFSPYDHAFTAANVTGSWTGSLFSGSIVYPNIHYGNDGTRDCPNYAFAGTSTLAALENTIDNSNSPLRLTDFKPAIKVRDVIDVIFSGSYTSGSTGYQYTSSFFESDYFNSLYLLTTANDALGPANNNPISQSSWVFRSGSTQVINEGPGGTLINFNAKSYDNSNNFDLGTDFYTCDISGSYTFTGQTTFNITSFTVAPNSQAQIGIVVSGSPSTILEVFTRQNVYANNNTLFFQGTYNLNAGDKVGITTLYNDPGSAGKTMVLQPGELNTFLQVRGPASVLGGNVNMSQQFPDDLKALDLIQAIIEKFNLVVEPVPNRKNLLSIEPYDTWFDSGAQVDYTDKIDRNVNFQISSPVIEQPRTIIFSDLEDKDYLNLYTNEVFNKTYGEYVFTSDSDLAEGERKIGKVFAPTPTTNIPNSTAFIIPHLCTKPVNSDSIYKPMAFKPRLLYGIGIKDVESQAAGFTAGSSSGTGSYFLRDEQGNVTQQNKWYQVSSLSETPISTDGIAFDLHFNNNNQGAGAIPPYWSNVSPNNFISGSGDAYTTYWANYINGLYDIDARKLVCNVYLTPNEIPGIRLNQKVFIDGAYYRINKINGANLSRRDSVEIEFIKTIARKLTFPRRRVRNSVTGVTRDIQFQGQNPNGGGVYNDFETGLVVNDFDTISQAGPLDGLRVFPVGAGGATASAVWNYSEPTIPILAQTSIGTNTVSADSSKVLTLGSKNSIGASVSTATALGQFNTIEQNVTNTFVVGQLNTIGETTENTQILGGTGNTISGNSNVNMTVMSSTGSTVSNSDYSTMINGYNATILDSDNTVAINSHENEVIVNGSGHVVVGLNNEGAGLDLLNYRNNSNWLGDTYLGESIFRDRKQLECGVGNISLTGSLPGQGRHENLYILNWSGLSPATMSIELPSTTNNDYKNIVYQFQANGTFDGTTQVNFVGFSGQTLNGLPSYSLSNAYEGVTFTTSGSGWLALAGGGGGSISTPMTASYLSAYNSSSFYPTSSVTASFQLPQIDFQNNISVVSGSRITIANDGVYDIQFSAQLTKDPSSNVNVYTWLSKNGTDIDWTNTEYALAGGSNEEVVIAWNWYVSASANDYYEIKYTADGNNAIFLAKTGTPGPDIPSVIVTVGSIGGGSTTISGSGGGCAEEVKVVNSDQPGPGEIYYYTSVQNTASVCQDLNTLDTFGLHYESNTNRHFLDTGLTVTGSVIATSFTGSLLGTASFAISASFAPNIYNSDGFLTNNRNVTLDGNNLTFLADSGESFIIASDPSAEVAISGLPQLTGSNIIYYNSASGQLTYGITPSGGGGTSASASFTGSTWTFNHNLGQEYVIVDIYDSSNEEIIPQSIDLTSINQAVISFPVSVQGVAVASLGNGTTINSVTNNINNITASFTNTNMISTISTNMGSATTSSVYVQKLNITASGTYNIHVSQSGPYWVDFNGLASATSANLNIYMYPDLYTSANSGSTVLFTAQSGSGNFVTYRTLVVSSAGEYFGTVATGIGTSSTTVSRNATRAQRSYGNSAVNPVVINRTFDGSVYLQNPSTPLVVTAFSYTGNQGTPIP